MKFFVVTLCVVGAVFGSTISRNEISRDIHDDFKDFLKLIPQEELLGIALDYLQNDPEVQGVAEYMTTDEFLTGYKKIGTNTELRNIIKYLQDAGLRVVETINTAADFLGLPPFPAVSRHRVLNRKTGEGFKGLIKDITSLLPKDDLKALFEDKMKSSPDFKALYGKLMSDEYKALIAAADKSPELLAFKAQIKQHGFDVDEFVNIIKQIFGLP